MVGVRPAGHLRARASAVKWISDSRRRSLSLASCAPGLEQEFSILEVRRVDATAVMVIIEQAAREGPCPECGVFSGAVKDRSVMRLKDLPVFGQTGGAVVAETPSDL